jgi:hypothetical protein
MPDAVPYVEPTDSSATIMRAVAAALADRWMVPQSWPRLLVALTGPANRLPQQARLWLIDRFVRNLGVPQSLASSVTAEGLARWAVDLYGSEGPAFDTVVLGAPSGGVGHLAALLGAPFLSEHFVTRYRSRNHPDDATGYLTCGSSQASTILENNPDLWVVSHFDPVHDRFLVPYVNYVRMKLVTLPAAYQHFIRRRVRPGGTILFADCRFGWGQYRVSGRHSFQVGGLGGIPDVDYVRGSPEVERYLTEVQGRQRKKPASPRRSWTVSLPRLPQRESEWGSLPAFRRAVETFASENGYRFLGLNGSHPADFSRMAFLASRQAIREMGLEPGGVLIDCFTLTSPTGALRAGLLPLWLPFNCLDSLRFLQDMAPQFPPGKPILLAPVPGFSPSRDVARAEQWLAACGPKADVTWLGIDPAAYPVDLAGIFRFLPALQTWCARNSFTVRPAFTVAGLEALIRHQASR